MRQLTRVLAGTAFACAISVAAILAQVGQGYWDMGAKSLQQFGMHVCPYGSAIQEVAGGDKKWNDFYCVTLTGEASKVEDVESRAKRKVASSHACPAGTWLRGMNIEENRFMCSRHPLVTVRNARDQDIQVTSHGTRKCGRGTVLVGYNENEGKVLCATVDGL